MGHNFGITCDMAVFLEATVIWHVAGGVSEVDSLTQEELVTTSVPRSQCHTVMGTAHPLCAQKPCWLLPTKEFRAVQTSFSQ